ncbi:hypothetical protein AB0F11_29400 [Streptomyces sp. NPDC032472]|uniref:hypothetical protein n=1 Tax=Streptomyces sp. NPDC032472 TaxID=3155018 RepID=UPI0033C7288F
MVWSEDEYMENLLGERRSYAWVMQRYGGMGAAEAERAAVECYPYEPADDEYRGLVFHDEAWHWAMKALYGHNYVNERPELVWPPPEYRALP